MKSFAVFLLCCSSVFVQSQIVLEHNGQGTFINFHEWGSKYVQVDWDEIVIYNIEDYSVMTSFNHYGWSTQYIFYISNALFDTDPNTIEYMVQPELGDTLKIYNNFGTVIFATPGHGTFGLPANNGGSYSPVYNTTSGTKMAVDTNVDRYVFSLPGTLIESLCCDEGIMAGINGSDELNGLPDLAFPNPAINSVRIDYVLPAGVHTADLNFYDISGNLVKSIKVGDAFSYVLLDISALAPGTYLYQVGNQPAQQLVKL